jgi:hypothetical protein
MDIRAEVNTQQVAGNLSTLAREFPRDVRLKGLPIIGQLLIAEAQSLAPIRTGFLANDSAFSRTENNSVVVGFNAAYAAAVHERHPSKPKFLASALAESARRIVVGVLTKVHASMQERLK